MHACFAIMYRVLLPILPPSQREDFFSLWDGLEPFPLERERERCRHNVDVPTAYTSPQSHEGFLLYSDVDRFGLSWSKESSIHNQYRYYSIKRGSARGSHCVNSLFSRACLPPTNPCQHPFFSCQVSHGQHWFSHGFHKSAFATLDPSGLFQFAK